jgi:hypothetical protein
LVQSHAIANIFVPKYLHSSRVWFPHKSVH